MQPKTKTFRVELGINLHSAPLPQTNPNMRLFPLQHALIDVTGGEDQAKPAWYAHLGIGDAISFRVVDISNLRFPEIEPEYPELALAEFYFNNPLTGQPTDPFTERVVDWRFSDRLDDHPSHAFGLGDSDRFSAWDLLAHDATGKRIDTLRFADFEKAESGKAFRAYELAVAIKIRRNGFIDHYVFDPEMIVSETDNEGDGGGGKKG